MSHTLATWCSSWALCLLTTFHFDIVAFAACYADTIWLLADNLASSDTMCDVSVQMPGPEVDCSALPALVHKTPQVAASRKTPWKC